MIPSAKIAKRCRLPPENRLRKPSTFEPPKLSEICLTAWVLMPGAGMYDPILYSASIAAVKSSFLRISGMRTELTRVATTAYRSLLVQERAGAARTLDLLAGALREPVRAHSQLLRELADAEDLDRNVLARGETAVLERRWCDLRAVVEARVEVAQVDRLRVRAAELLERHRLLHRRAAQLAEPHVDRHLAALEVHGVAVAGARAPALVAAARGLAGARALAATHALPAVARALRRLEG